MVAARPLGFPASEAVSSTHAPRPARTPEEQAEVERQIADVKAMTPEDLEEGIAYWQAFFDSLPAEQRESFDAWGREIAERQRQR